MAPILFISTLVQPLKTTQILIWQETPLANLKTYQSKLNVFHYKKKSFWIVCAVQVGNLQCRRWVNDGRTHRAVVMEPWEQSGPGTIHHLEMAEVTALFSPELHLPHHPTSFTSFRGGGGAWAMCTSMYSCADLCMYVRAQRPEEGIRCPALSRSTFFSWDRVSPQTRSHAGVREACDSPRVICAPAPTPDAIPHVGQHSAVRTGIRTHLLAQQLPYTLSHLSSPCLHIFAQIRVITLKGMDL